MKRKHPLLLVLAVLGLLSSTTTFADNMSGFHALYTPATDVTQLPQNAYAGTIGGIFLASGSTWPYVNALGYADPLDQGLANSHVVNLYYDGGNGGSTIANKEIAWRLKISEHTVKFHLTSIFNKLDASTRAEAVAIGARHGLIIL
jgi:hypothetical protein